MKGSTHLVIGAAVGAAAAVYYPFSIQNAAFYVTVSAFSALSPDLDGPSMLSARLGKLSRIVKEAVPWLGGVLSLGAVYLYYTQGTIDVKYTTLAVMLLLLGFVAKVGIIRNALVSFVGCGLMYVGYTGAMNWLIGFGLFVAWVPWLKHRGLTHTVWAVGIWGMIAAGLEQQLQIEGIQAVAIAGYLSHLIADTLTPSGIKWLYPLYNKSIKL